MAKKQRIKTVTLDPKTWIRGDGHGGSQLLRADGMQCCLGFACGAYGVPVGRFRNKAELARVRGLPEALRFSHSFGQPNASSIWGVYSANDRGELSDSERVERINAVLDAMSASFRFRLKKSRRAVAVKPAKAKRAKAPAASEAP